MKLYERLADLPLAVESWTTEDLSRRVSSGFERHTTVVHLLGHGEQGVGEDVIYDGGSHRAFQSARPRLPLTGVSTLDEFSKRLSSLDTFAPLLDPVSRGYRQWAFESAALDLALRQSGLDLARAIGLEPRPVRFVVSLRLGEPPSVAPVLRWLEVDPTLQFKIDATSSCGDDVLCALADTGAVEIVDLKGAYRGTIVDQRADPALYARVVDAFPHAWIEDPSWTVATSSVLDAHRERITWDAPIHSVADIESLPFPPRMLNVKPSRFGTLAALLDAYDYCRVQGIETYGGGQFELGPGRGQIQVLAALFHPDGPNDVAPAGYNDPEPRPELEQSPLDPRPSPTGFRREIA